MNLLDKEEALYKQDMENREELIKKSLLIGTDSLSRVELDQIVQSGVMGISKLYKSQIIKYNGNMLTSEIYKAADFHFNDAGFQFKWRNHRGIIQLECLTWKEVLRRIKSINKTH